jgi:hypothetical protein
VTFVFNSGVLGGLPTRVGIVVTGPGPASRVEFLNRSGSIIETVVNPIEESGINTTGGDRFVGIYYPDGIGGVRVINKGTGNQGLEVDHLQYGDLTPVAPLLMPLMASEPSGSSGSM